MDGKPADAKTFARKRAVFHNALEYAVELGKLQNNVLPRISSAPEEVKAIDKLTVIIRIRRGGCWARSVDRRHLKQRGVGEMRPMPCPRR